jgi:hypothetical protein
MKMCEDFAPNIGDKITGCCILSSPTHPTFLCFPRLRIKLKGLHFEVVEAESQVVLNTLAEHNFQDAFKKKW